MDKQTFKVTAVYTPSGQFVKETATREETVKAYNLKQATQLANLQHMFACSVTVEAI